MANFADIQSKLDTDETLCRQILADPVGVLLTHGVSLSPQQAFELQMALCQANSKRTNAETQET